MKNLTLFLVILSIFISCIQQKPEQILQRNDDRPNIVLIVADDHGTDDMGCYGNSAIKTPALDQLASEGVRFNKAYCTTASCSASRSVILSGIYNHANGQYGHQHAYHHFSSFSHLKTLPVLLSENGYVTARIGKYHVAPEEVYKFDVVLKGGGRNNVAMADSTKKFIAGHKSKPFFLYFCFNDPHRGGGTNENNPYKPDRFGNSDEGFTGVERNRPDPGEVIVPDYLPDTPPSRAELVEYYESVNRLDQGVGRLVQHIKDAGLWENTIFMYISDNGIAFPGAKTNVYNPGMRLPCIVRNPLIPRVSETSDAMINWADLAPTILDFAGILPEEGSLLDSYVSEPEKERLVRNMTRKSMQGQPVFADFQGRSFKSVLETGDETGWDETFASHTFHEITMYYPMRVAMNRKYKIIWNIAHGLDYPFASDLWASATWQSVINSEENIKMYGPRPVESYIHRPQFELFDIEHDPLETKNLASDPKYAAVLDEMKEMLKNFQQRTQDPWVVKWEYE